MNVVGNDPDKVVLGLLDVTRNVLDRILRFLEILILVEQLVPVFGDRCQFSLDFGQLGSCCDHVSNHLIVGDPSAGQIVSVFGQIVSVRFGGCFLGCFLGRFHELYLLAVSGFITIGIHSSSETSTNLKQPRSLA